MIQMSFETLKTLLRPHLTKKIFEIATNIGLKTSINARTL